MTYAIIETGGKQLRVEPGRFYDVEKLHLEPGEALTIDRVLLVEHEGTTHVGQPTVEGATVETKVLEQRRGRKIIVFKMHRKKNYRRKQGHRQDLTRLFVQSISLNGETLAQAETEPASEVEATELTESEVPEMVEATDSTTE
ncbi:50S ribosomal protein L21 [Geitlerinema sp. PCC 9228]|jgi:large subunit ribosomal protein L21|uniref:50S ribosomal protein L21 n=1 Tax=Geitlerinema sp. PCC 9228 TaxID=111611 RepID=UPI0008F9A7AE|nr:50S ribosomal protein L21 [Geitlerinema sp. PCC 9228]